MENGAFTIPDQKPTPAADTQTTRQNEPPNLGSLIAPVSLVFEKPSILGTSELKELSFWRAILAEALATLLYIFIVCGSGASKPDNLHSCLVTGFTVALLANTFWDISGGHFNPAVTVGLAVVGKVKVVRCVCYVVAQCAGSVIATALLYAYIPPNIRGELGALKHHPDISPGIGFLIELTISYQMMLVIVSSTDPVRGHTGFQAPFAIGLSVTIALMMGIPFTSAAANPIRAFGPAVVLNIRENQWIYWAGPITGGVLGSLSYKYILKQPEATSTTMKELRVATGRLGAEEVIDNINRQY